jgi:hypothetical protein
MNRRWFPLDCGRRLHRRRRRRRQRRSQHRRRCPPRSVRVHRCCLRRCRRRCRLRGCRRRSRRRCRRLLVLRRLRQPDWIHGGGSVHHCRSRSLSVPRRRPSPAVYGSPLPSLPPLSLSLLPFTPLSPPLPRSSPPLSFPLLSSPPRRRPTSVGGCCMPLYVRRIRRCILYIFTARGGGYARLQLCVCAPRRIASMRVGCRNCLPLLHVGGGCGSNRVRLSYRVWAWLNPVTCATLASGKLGQCCARDRI